MCVGIIAGMHSRRARPTLRVLKEDLTAEWKSPHPRRMLAQGRHDELHPLSELPHPLVEKATDAIRHDTDVDNVAGPIACSKQLQLWEIKSSQWRGGVWKEPDTGVHWLVVAGLALGGHEDRDDFYERVKRDDAAGRVGDWLPTEADRRLLKRETAARLVTEWELAIQRQLRDGLREIHAGGSLPIRVAHPVLEDEPIATINLEVSPVREEGYSADEVEVEIVSAKKYLGSQLEWQLRLRVLISLSPPEQGWDRYQQSNTNIAEPGAWAARLVELDELVAANELAESQPGANSHYAHREHLAGKTIEGRSIRTLCGVFFVPTQDHDRLPRCPKCETEFGGLPS